MAMEQQVGGNCDLKVVKIARTVGSGARLMGVVAATLGTTTYSWWRAKKAFRDALREMGLPDETISELTREFPSPRKIIPTTTPGWAQKAGV